MTRSCPLLRIAAASAVLLAVATGCDLFATRNPQTSTGGGSQWLRPTSPDLIVTNLRVAFENGIFNDYQRALTEDFRFHPDSADSLDMATTERPGEDVYVDWTREVETVTAETIALAADSLRVTLDLFSDDFDPEGRRELKYVYLLSVWRNDVETPYTGEAWFLIRQEANGEWYIQEWLDIRAGDGNPSWGFLKGLSRP